MAAQRGASELGKWTILSRLLDCAYARLQRAL